MIFRTNFWQKEKLPCVPCMPRLLKQFPNCIVKVKRIVLGNTIIDHERVSGTGNEKIEAVAEYEIVNGKIVRVYFKN